MCDASHFGRLSTAEDATRITLDVLREHPSTAQQREDVEALQALLVSWASPYSLSAHAASREMDLTQSSESAWKRT